MDSQTIQPTLWECVQSSQSLSDNQTPQQNRIRWSQSPDSHTFSVDLPGNNNLQYIHYKLCIFIIFAHVLCFSFS